MSLTSILHDIFTSPVTEDVARMVPGTALAFRVNDVVRKAKSGDRDAQAKLAAIRKLADAGDPKAQATIDQAKVAVSSTPAQGRGGGYYALGVSVGHDPYNFVGAVYCRNLPPGTVVRDHGTPSTKPAPGQPGSGFHYEGRRLVPCDPRLRAQLATKPGVTVVMPSGQRVTDHRSTVTPAMTAAQQKAYAANLAATWGGRVPTGPQVTPGYGSQYDAQGNYLGTTDPGARGSVTVDPDTGQAYDPSTGTTFDPNTGQVISQPGQPQAPGAVPPGYGVDPMTGQPYGAPGGYDPYTGLPVPGGLPYPGGPGYGPTFPGQGAYPYGLDPYAGQYNPYANPYGGFAPPGYGANPYGQGVYDPYGLLGLFAPTGQDIVTAPRRQVYDPDTCRFYSDDVKMKYDADTNSFSPVQCDNPYAQLEQFYGGDPYGGQYNPYSPYPQVAGWGYNRPYRTNSEALVQRSPGVGAGLREMYNRGLGQPATTQATVVTQALRGRPTALAAYGLARKYLG